MRSTKKTVSLFQSHVFKHEFFLFPVARSLFPLNDNIRCLVEKVPDFGQIFSVLWPLDQYLNRDPQKVVWRD
ncbi:hypothetical protein AA650_04400 [Anabaena sp. WA102]|nr:hypothetical protein AA650_04400 [Anabaena sp. WA102]OBQ20679.1 MAG: hypothetical protein AN486_06020 [Anabaena sp. AL93]